MCCREVFRAYARRRGVNDLRLKVACYELVTLLLDTTKVLVMHAFQSTWHVTDA